MKMIRIKNLGLRYTAGTLVVLAGLILPILLLAGIGMVVFDLGGHAAETSRGFLFYLILGFIASSSIAAGIAILVFIYWIAKGFVDFIKWASNELFNPPSQNQEEE